MRNIYRLNTRDNFFIKVYIYTTLCYNVCVKGNISKGEKSMNKFLATGRLTADPVIRYSQSENQTCIANFTLAIDRKFKRDGQPSADFVRCVAYGKTGEFVEKYFHKGMKADIVSHIQSGSYQDKNGNTVYTTDAIIEEIDFGESKKASENNANNTPTDSGFENTDDGFTQVDNSDLEGLPFN